VFLNILGYSKKIQAISKLDGKINKKQFEMRDTSANDTETSKEGNKGSLHQSSSITPVKSN
jgi:hypothetical protein